MQFQKSFADAVARDVARIPEMLKSIVTDHDDFNMVSRLQAPALETFMGAIQQELQEVPRDSSGAEPSRPTSSNTRGTFRHSLAELKRRTGVLPPLIDLTGQVVRQGTSPFEYGGMADIWHGSSVLRTLPVITDHTS